MHNQTWRDACLSTDGQQGTTKSPLEYANGGYTARKNLTRP